MASNPSSSVTNGESDESNLKALFDDGMKLLENVNKDKEPTNSSSVQANIKRAMKKFEDATRLVSAAGIFSRNESIEELPTESLQYLLLPALLGVLSLKICNKPRKEIVDVAEIYFRDFLQRCQDYSVTSFELPDPAQKDHDDNPKKRSDNPINKITKMVLSRDAKIKRFKEAKELEEKVFHLKKAMDSEVVDDQTKREYFTSLLLSYINESLDELNSLEAEKSILDFMEKRAKGGALSEQEKTPPATPLKPIIITKDAIQKAVYGLGYPGIPTVTIEEFYENRVKEGTFPGPSGVNIPHTVIETADGNNPEELEAIEKEKQAEDDDPESLERARAFDEYKDTHCRGWGNRYNRS